MKEKIWEFFNEMLEEDDHTVMKSITIGIDETGTWAMVAEWREVDNIWKIYAKIGHNTDEYCRGGYADWTAAEDSVEACLGTYEIDPEKIDWLAGQWKRIYTRYIEDDDTQSFIEIEDSDSGEDFIIVPDDEEKN